MRALTFIITFLACGVLAVAGEVTPSPKVELDPTATNASFGHQLSSGVADVASDRLLSRDSNRVNSIGMVSTSSIPLSGLAFVPQKLVHLPPNEFAKVVLAAERSNNVSAAVDLAEYYGYAVYDVDKEIKYLKIAATHGHVVSQYSLGFIYYHDPRFKNLATAKYWLEIAAQSGSEEAKFQLHEHRRQFEYYSDVARLGLFFLSIALVLSISGIVYFQIAKRKHAA